MKDDESLVEAAVKMLVLVFIMYLLASTWYFTFLQYRNGSSANTPDDMSLAGLARLSFNDNSTNSQLLHAGFWSTALAESGRTIAYMAHDSIFGLIQSSKQWNDLFSENMDNPPPWLSQGLPLYLANFFAKLDAEAIGAGNAAAAGRVMKNFTSFVAGLSAAGVDFASYNGLSALRRYLSTGSVTESAATTFPGQIYKLYSLSFNSSYPEEVRAQFFGRALAITGIVIVTAGHGGFTDKFEGMLSRLNLLEAWPKIKAYLKDIGTTSPSVAYGAAMVLEKLASRFPETFKDASGLTAERIDTMVQVLKDKGLTADEIKGKVAEVAKAAEESNAVGSSAEAADKISYDSEGAIRVKIGKNLQPYLHSEGTAVDSITASLLEKIVPGFQTGSVAALKITVHRGDELFDSYNIYQGGKSFEPTLPEEQVRPGETIPISIETVPVQAFVGRLRSFELTNPAMIKWAADRETVEQFNLVGNVFSMKIAQDYSLADLKEFVFGGNVEKYPGLSNQQGGIYMQFSMTDYAGNTEEFRIRHDAFDTPTLQFPMGDKFKSVFLVSYDGYRLSVIYGPEKSVATIYIHPPSEAMYRLGEAHAYSGPYLVPVSGRYSAAYAIDGIEFVRNLEKTMLKNGNTYDTGRLGAEIAYVVGTSKLGLKDLILVEPSKGGRDLYTRGGTVAIQARFLIQRLPVDQFRTAIQNALVDLTSKLQQDYENQDKMVQGYAILSYVDTDGTVKSIILEVPKR